MPRYADHLIAMTGGRIAISGAPRDVVTPTLLRDVFGVEADVLTDPRSGVTLCIPYGVSHAIADELEPVGVGLEVSRGATG